MRKVFVGFTAPKDLVPVATSIDELVIRHHGPVVRRTHPLHVTVMAPRMLTEHQYGELQACVHECNAEFGALFARVKGFACYAHAQKMHLVTLLNGSRLCTAIDHFHQQLSTRLQFERRKHEGRSPHVTLLSSSHVGSHRLFELAKRDALNLELPREVVVPELFVHVVKGRHLQQAPIVPKDEPVPTGWHP